MNLMNLRMNLQHCVCTCNGHLVLHRVLVGVAWNMCPGLVPHQMHDAGSL